MTAPYTDLGQTLATNCLTAVTSATTAASLAPPAATTVIHGTGIPIEDACAGMLWARVASVYPTDGSGNPFLAARIDFDIPAWAVSIDVGYLWCRTNINEAGEGVTPAEETAYAVRDSGYRMALLDGVANYLPPLVKPCGLGMRVSPWAPIGPEGGLSGGLVNVTIITTALAGVGL